MNGVNSPSKKFLVLSLRPSPLSRSSAAARYLESLARLNCNQLRASTCSSSLNSANPRIRSVRSELLDEVVFTTVSFRYSGGGPYCIIKLFPLQQLIPHYYK